MTSLLTLLVISATWMAAGPAIARTLPGGRPAVALSVRGKFRATAVSPYRFLEGPLCRLEQGLFADAADGRWDEHTLLGAALVASGVSDAGRLKGYQMQMADWAAELERSGQVAGPPQAKAQAVLEFMHQRILHGGYELNSTDVALTLDEGRFNSVSASVLFNCLAARVGLN